MHWHFWSVQTVEDVSRSLSAIKMLLHSSGGEDTSADVLAQLSMELCSGPLLPMLIGNLGKIDFEASKFFCVTVSFTAVVPSLFESQQFSAHSHVVP